MIDIMNKIQIQLPDPLYGKLKKLSKSLDYSMAELLRRGAEHIVLLYGHIEDAPKASKLPPTRKLGLKIEDPSLLRELANSRD